MHFKGIFRLVASLFLVFALIGCGGGEGNSNTGGTLTISASATPASGVYVLQATSVLTPIQVGSKITFNAVQFGYNSSTSQTETFANVTAEISTDKTGTAYWTYNFTPAAFDTTLQVTASSGGLHQTAAPIQIPKQ